MFWCDAIDTVAMLTTLSKVVFFLYFQKYLVLYVYQYNAIKKQSKVSFSRFAANVSIVAQNEQQCIAGKLSCFSFFLFKPTYTVSYVHNTLK